MCAVKSYITPGANIGEDPFVGIPSQAAHAKLCTGKRPRNPGRVSHKELERIGRKFQDSGISNKVFEIPLKYTMRNNKVCFHLYKRIFLFLEIFKRGQWPLFWGLIKYGPARNQRPGLESPSCNHCWDSISDSVRCTFPPKYFIL